MTEQDILSDQVTYELKDKGSAVGQARVKHSMQEEQYAPRH